MSPSLSPLVLASQSPSRLRLLRAAGIDPQIDVSGVAEDRVDASEPKTMVAVLARRKAEAIAPGHPDAVVLGCDSALELDGVAHGKPASPEEATTRWRRMRGAHGILHTGHCLIATGPGQGDETARAEGVASTVVRFGHPTDADIDAYVASGEPLAVAGAFTLDGLSAPFIDGVDGDPSNVIGLSLPLLRLLLAEVGVTMTELWNRPRGAQAGWT